MSKLSAVEKVEAEEARTERANELGMNLVLQVRELLDTTDNLPSPANRPATFAREFGREIEPKLVSLRGTLDELLGLGSEPTAPIGTAPAGSGSLTVDEMFADAEGRN